MLQYILRIADYYQDEKAEELPVIIPLVYYHGARSPYPHSTNIIDCFTNKELAKTVMFQPFQLIDLTILPDHTIRQHQHAAVMEMLHKHFYRNYIDNAIEQLLNNSLLKMICSLEHGEYLEVVLKYTFQAECFDKRELMRNIAKTLSNPEEKIMTSVAEYLRQEGEERAHIKINTIAEQLRQEGEERAYQKVMRHAEQLKNEARNETRTEITYRIAQELLKQGVTPEIIVKTTGLAKEQLEQLKQESVI